MKDRAPEQQVVDYLEAAGYKPAAIIRYLEAQVEREWGREDFAECGPGEKMTFGVCRKIGEAPAAQPAQQGAAPSQPQAQQPGQPAAGGQQPKPKEQPKSAMEEKLEKAAKAQGSDPTNNKKVMIDGKAYGWAIQGGKPIMVEWGSVAGEKKVGPKSEKPKRQGRGGRGGSRAGGGGNADRIEGLRRALEGQVNDAGRQAIMDQIKELGG